MRYELWEYISGNKYIAMIDDTHNRYKIVKSILREHSFGIPEFNHEWTNINWNRDHISQKRLTNEEVFLEML